MSITDLLKEKVEKQLNALNEQLEAAEAVAWNGWGCWSRMPSKPGWTSNPQTTRMRCPISWAVLSPTGLRLAHSKAKRRS